MINRIEGDLPDPLRRTAENLGVPLLGVLPRDPAVAEYDIVGRPFIELSDDSLIYTAVQDLLRRALA